MSFSDHNFDQWLDGQLRDVPLPAGLSDRLRRLAALDNRELDAALREVPMPQGALLRLQRIAQPKARRVRPAKTALAASLAVAIALCYLGVTYGLLWATLAGTKPMRPSLIALASVPDPEADRTPRFLAATAAEDREADAGDLPATIVMAPRIGPPGENESEGPPPGKTDDLMMAMVTGRVDPLLDATLERWGVFGAHRQFDERPELKKVPGLARRGIDIPLVPGFDFAWFGLTGVHPFVSPASHAELRTSVVPLDIDAASYELTRRYLEDGQLPQPGKVRTEEFLAAVDYGFARPKKETMALSTAAGPSVFGKGLRLLQIGVQARDLPPADRPPVNLTLAVDVSASMRWGGRLEMVRRGLGQLIDRLRPDDRVNLVAFNEYAERLVEDVGRGRDESLRAAVDMLSAGGPTNVGEGLRQAYAVAQQRPQSGLARHVVLLTDGLAELDAGTVDRIERRLADAASRGIILNVIDLGQDKKFRELDPKLVGFAQTGMGRIRPAGSADEVRRALLEVITGKSRMVAADVRLEVAFEPKTVLAYRLLGHEATAMASLRPARPECDFHAGQSATALYEVRLRPGKSGQAAVATLTWRHPADGTLHRACRKISTRDLTRAGSLADAPKSLQASAVAALTAEVLRESPFVWRDPTPISLTKVLRQARQVNARLQNHTSLANLVLLVEQAEKAKPFRKRGR